MSNHVDLTDIPHDRILPSLLWSRLSYLSVVSIEKRGHHFNLCILEPDDHHAGLFTQIAVEQQPERGARCVAFFKAMQPSQLSPRPPHSQKSLA